MSSPVTIEKLPFESLRSRTKGDKVIWTAVFLLSIVSLLVVYSSAGLLAYKMYKGNTEVYLFKQFAFILVGILIIYFAHQVNYTLYSGVARILFILSIPLLLYTLFFGVQLNEGSRWIRLPIINMTFQTSDLAKLAPGQKLIAINGRTFSADRLQEVITEAKTSKEPIHLLMQTEDYIKPVDIDYHDGQRYPVLVRDDSQKDYLDEITTPLTEEAKKAREQAPTHARPQSE